MDEIIWMAIGALLAIFIYQGVNQCWGCRNRRDEGWED